MQERLALYRAQALHYLENAFIALRQGDVEKAGEFLWGSMAEALKAVAAHKGTTLRQHREIREFARAIANELGERALWDAYGNAEHLHANFYEVELSLEDVAAIGESVKRAVERLLGLAEEPLPVSG
ncbi:MAG: hypothetical protein HYY00_01085 [Chloroflexi bacterium]|nr:hypothetical protein [Chloroflexota bacterium]